MTMAKTHLLGYGLRAMRPHATTRPTIAEEIRIARSRDARERAMGMRATSARYDRRAMRILLELSNGCLFGFPVSRVDALAAASPSQLAAVEVSPGGSALRWDALDVDLSFAGLLLDAVGRRQRLQELARLAGQVTSKAKARAARENGAKGGRPRKSKV